MEKSIIDITNDGKTIKELYSKVKAFEKEVNQLSFKNFKKSLLISYIISLIFFSPIYIITVREIIIGLPNIETSNFLVIIVFFIAALATFIIFSMISFMLSLLINVFKYNLIKDKDKSMFITNFNENVIIYDKKTSEMIKNFETSLNQKEKEYYNDKTDTHFFELLIKKNGDLEYFLNDIYQKKIEKEKPEYLIQNKTQILEGIKENFNIDMQKNLINLIAKKIEKSNIEKELNNLDSKIKNFEKIENQNNIEIENN